VIVENGIQIVMSVYLLLFGSGIIFIGCIVLM